MSKFKFSVAIVSVIFSTFSHAAKQPEKIDVSAKNDEYVSMAKGLLVECQGVYGLEVDRVQLAIDQNMLDRKIKSGSSWEYANKNLERMSAEKEVLDKKRKDGFEYVRCAESSKDKMKDSAKGYVSLFKKENLKTYAKQVVSQWFVTIDTVGKKNFIEESSKFDKATNDLKTELMVN